jgi:quinol monooxygenase YgiN
MSEIVIIATITAVAGQEAALTSVLQGLVGPSRLEEGCKRYDLHRDPVEPAVLVFLETWSSREAHQTHLKTPHFLAARAAQEGLVRERSVRFLEAL